jgi:hypothetical protein
MAGGRPRGGSKLTALPSAERDGRETWSRETLEAMDARFTAAMHRAIASGQERVCDTVGGCLPLTTPRLPAS